MMSSRGMGAINPKKMPKGVRKSRRDDTDFTEYSDGGETDSEKEKSVMDMVKGRRSQYEEPTGEYGPREPTDSFGRMKMRPDVSMLPEGIRAMPRYAELNKDFKAVGSRLFGSKKLDKDTYLEGYVDLDSTYDKMRGNRTRGSGAGVNLIKNFKNGGKTKSKVNQAGVYTKPAMRKSLFESIKSQSVQGTAAGQWSARKAQLLAKQYKAKGGGYK
jgi:hypothetical protein